jgi:putative peptidoglycan lipid II flippase
VKLTEGIREQGATTAGITRVVESPLVRGGLTLVAGILAGNVLGFGRVAVTAYFLGTHSRADSLAVAIGPMDTLNSILINSLVFAFVPMLAAARGGQRTALFRDLARWFFWVSCAITAAVVVSAPALMRVLAPGLEADYFETAVNVLRILAFSTMATATGAIHCGLLYTQRRFAPTAFYQAALNLFTIISALCLWKLLGVYAFALGYTAGAWAQLAIVYFASRSGLEPAGTAESPLHWSEVLGRPVFFIVYAAGLGLNITFTRAYATQAGPGMAAALDYCMRGVGVPLALLVSPVSNSLLPEIARLRSLFRMREAFRLIDRTIALAALAAIGGCAFAIVFRHPAIELFFERGSFTAQSTNLVSAVFLGLGPSLVGWSLIEIGSRSLFALDRPWPPVIAAVVPVFLNVALTLRIHSLRPELLGLGSSIGLLAGFAVLFAAMHYRRARWMKTA